MQDLRTAPGVEYGDLLQGREGDLVGGRVAEGHPVELDGHRPFRHPPGIRLLRDERLQVEDLEDPLETHQRAHHLDAGPGESGQRGVQPGQEQGERDDGAGVQGPAQGVVAAESVDEREGQRRDQGEGRDERRLGHRGADPDVPYACRPDRELGGLVGGPAEQLDQRRAGRREPFGHLGAHRGVQRRGLPLHRRHPRPHPAGRQDEHGQQHQRQQGDLPGDAQHHDEGQQQGDEVGDDAREGVAERPLRADDVVVEAADEGAGPGPGEEGDRHPLHVVEDGRPQIQDQPLAEGGGEPAGQQPEPRLRDRDQRDEEGEPGHHGAVPAVHDGGDDPAGEHRRGHRQQGRHHAQQEEENEPAAVRAGERGHAAQTGPGEGAAVLLGVDRAVQ